MKIEHMPYIEIFERMQGMNKDEEWHFDFKLEKCQYRVENVVCPFRPKYNGTCVRITCTPFIRGKRYTMPSNLKAYENAIIPVWNLDSIVEFIEIQKLSKIYKKYTDIKTSRCSSNQIQKYRLF